MGMVLTIEAKSERLVWKVRLGVVFAMLFYNIIRGKLNAHVYCMT